MTDAENMVEYYKDLLLNQWVNSVNARATIGVLAGAAVCDLVPLAIRDGFDIETAIGAQLDILGEYIGFNRNIPIEVERDYFQFDDYTGPNTDAVGMSDYTDPSVNPNGVFYRYVFSNTVTTALADDEYRFLLKLKVLLNNSDNTLYYVTNLLYEFFGGDVYCVDNADMTIDYYVSETANYIAQIAVDQGLLPKPMGVEITNIYTF
jgi:hypothetical protein